MLPILMMRYLMVFFFLLVGFAREMKQKKVKADMMCG